jgi:hypothetical protein
VIESESTTRASDVTSLISSPQSLAQQRSVAFELALSIRIYSVVLAQHVEDDAGIGGGLIGREIIGSPTKHFAVVHFFHLQK